MKVFEHYQKILISKTVGLVEARPNEVHQIWWHFIYNKTYSNPNIHMWHQHGGWLHHIGEVGGRPICLSLTFDEVSEGKVLCFYDITSELADWKMAVEWLKEVFPDIPMSDATNFTNIFRR